MVKLVPQIILVSIKFILIQRHLDRNCISFLCYKTNKGFWFSLGEIESSHLLVADSVPICLSKICSTGLYYVEGDSAKPWISESMLKSSWIFYDRQKCLRVFIHVHLRFPC